MAKGSTILAIDANAIIHRAFHAFPPNLVTTSGLQVNAVYGFTSMLLSVLDQFEPEYIFCAFDTPKPTFRHTKYVDYKAHRKPTDKSLLDQFPVVEEVLNAFNIPIIKKEGYEADDILGTVSKWVREGKWEEYGLDLVIVSGDRDLLQLISSGESKGRVRVALPVGSFKNLLVHDAEATYKRYGYRPDQVIDYKAVVGDASDNIPGIKGVGDKSALELLQRFQTLEGIYEHIDELKPRQQKLFSEGVEQAYFSRELATIEQDMDLALPLESALLRDFNREEVLSLFQRLEFRSLVTKIPQSSRQGDGGDQLGIFGGEGKGEGIEGESIGEELGVMFTESLEVESVQFLDLLSDVEVLYLLMFSGDLLYGAVDKSGKLLYGVGGIEGCGTWLLKLLKVTPATCETILYDSESIFSSVVGAEMSENGDEILDTLSVSALDLKLAAFHFSSGLRDYTLGAIIFNEIGKNISDKVESGKDVLKLISLCSKVVDQYKQKITEYRLGDYSTRRIGSVKRYYELGDSAIEAVIYGLESEVSLTLARMESRGVKGDLIAVEAAKIELEGRVQKLQESVYHAVGHEFNLNSPKQLGEVLFDELHLPGGGRSKSTREEVLLTLKEMHPAIEPMLEYREVSKILSTYVKPFEEILRNSGDGSIHTDFVQTGASSGRFSSQNPNMQNIPARGDMAALVRKFFVPREGFKLASFDYSQIEYRIIADASDDPVLISYFEEGQDIHRNTAAKLFKVKVEDVTSEQRSVGKTVNFGILYGQTKYGLSRMLGISPDEADLYIKTYYQTYEGVAQYMNRAVQEAQVLGYVESMFGRRRYVSGLNSANNRIMNAAVREAINMPMQGSAADIMKLAMIAIQREIDREWSGKVFLLLQIHDEFVLEIDQEIVEQVGKRVCEIMENVVKLSLPLEVGWGYGDNLAEIKG